MSRLKELEKLKRVSQISTAKDIKQLSLAQFPGTHCPLFGVALTAGYIKGLFVLVVGSDECTYYTKSFSIDRANSLAGLEDNFLSFALTKDDVVFSCQGKVREAVMEIDRRYRPQAILLVTTCILEVIGEDLAALICEVQEQVQAKLLLVKTEHFKCDNHIPGIERSLEVMLKLMEEQPRQEKTVNLLGHRYSGVEDTELLKVLRTREVQVHMVLPASSSIDLLKTAPAAALNIVTDFTSLKLAQKMKEKFKVPYVYFEKYLNLERIERGYREIGAKLGLSLEQEVKEMKGQVLKAQQQYQGMLRGKRFLYANTPLLAFELSGFLAALGMEPVLIQARDLYADDEQYLKEILATGHDPYVSRVANIALLRQLYDHLSLDIYIGHENPMLLMEKGIVQVVLDGVAKKLGFEVPLLVMQALADAISVFKYRRKGEHHAAAL